MDINTTHFIGVLFYLINFLFCSSFSLLNFMYSSSLLLSLSNRSDYCGFISDRLELLLNSSFGTDCLMIREVFATGNFPWHSNEGSSFYGVNCLKLLCCLLSVILLVCWIDLIGSWNINLGTYFTSLSIIFS
jgi:hypothetical protein